MAPETARTQGHISDSNYNSQKKTYQSWLAESIHSYDLHLTILEERPFVQLNSEKCHLEMCQYENCHGTNTTWPQNEKQ